MKTTRVYHYRSSPRSANASNASPSSLRSSLLTSFLILSLLIISIHLVFSSRSNKHSGLTVTSSSYSIKDNYEPRAFNLVKRQFSDDESASPETNNSGHDHPQEEERPSYIPYFDMYDSVHSWGARILVLAGFCAWLVFLFSSVGIVASDFFCPNLSTLSGRLGLSEGVAGATLLAFGNGSPDVFSTFSAFRADAGSLAVGELLGAASFIVAVVTGTMAIIQPFQVPKHSFIRDVGFFTLAVTMSLISLSDLHIHLWEAITMVCVYIIYVIYVGFSSWWLRRRQRRRDFLHRVRSEFAEEPPLLPYQDNPQEDTDAIRPSVEQHISSLPTSRTHSRTSSTSSKSNGRFSPSASQFLDEQEAEETMRNLTDLGTPVALTREALVDRPSSPLFQEFPTSSGGPSASAHHPPSSSDHYHKRPPVARSQIRTSLLSAIEFRDVVNSLRDDSVARTLAVFGSAHPHHHHHRRNRSTTTNAIAPRPSSPGLSVSNSNRPSLLHSSSVDAVQQSLGRSRSKSVSAQVIPSSPQLQPSTPISSPHSRHSRSKSAESGQVFLQNQQEQKQKQKERQHQQAQEYLSTAPLRETRSDDGYDGSYDPNVYYSAIEPSRNVNDFLEQQQIQKRWHSSSKQPSSPSTSLNPTEDNNDDNLLSDNIDMKSLSSDQNPEFITHVNDQEQEQRENQNQNQNQNSKQSSKQDSYHPVLRIETSNLTPPSSPFKPQKLPVPVKPKPQSQRHERQQVDNNVPSIVVTGDDGQPTQPRMSISSASDLTRSTSFWNNDESLKISKGFFIQLLRELFPSLQGFESKSLLGRFASLFAVPTLLGLKLTLPVVLEDEDEDECDSDEEKEDNENEDHVQEHQDVEHTNQGRQHHHHQDFDDDVSNNDGDDNDSTTQEHQMNRRDHERIARQLYNRASSPISPTGHSDDESHDAGSIKSNEQDEQERRQLLLQHNDANDVVVLSRPLTHYDDAPYLKRILPVIQCTLAAPFVTLASQGDDLLWWYIPLSLGIGASLGLLSYKLYEKHEHWGRVLLCVVGFIVSAVWIMMLVNEVVGVLQAVGKIFHVSDAILGVTIFATGNSMGDLVANMTVARMGFPVMAFSACFAGPMLNIMFGVGMSGLYVVLSRGGTPYKVDMNGTLFVSAFGLLAILATTLVTVPMQGYWLTRGWGITLICAYIVIMMINVSVEIYNA